MGLHPLDSAYVTAFQWMWLSADGRGGRSSSDRWGWSASLCFGRCLPWRAGYSQGGRLSSLLRPGQTW